MPSKHLEHTFASWSKKYGDLMYNESFGHRTIIINSQRVARDLLEKRGAKYSNRPRMTMLVELIGWDPIPALLPYRSEGHRKQRRWTWSAFGDKKSVQKYKDLGERETCIFLLGLMETPDDYALHIKRYLAGLVLESVYGHRITSLEDEYVTLMDNAMEATTTTTGAAGGALVDIIPILKYVPAWLPGAGFKRAALHARSLVSGDAPPSFTSALVEKAQKMGQLTQDENLIRYAAGNIYGAATDTTQSALLTFFLAMVLHPEVYNRAQEEVDRVVGKNRLPTSEDRPHLPYIEAVLKETYRWHAPVILGKSF
ncbi:cytochrome P450 [Fomitopsis serialis]|uniref:cytochrome P450 n=1 Tax=Fomitopsis serialis TaxID=139415 RepID=UPI002008602A|nr:cytochrome P450 [Neoantrodia serialis]KAH9929346.1 cytochrome P450 [Neoantrodia serialis]